MKNLLFFSTILLTLNSAFGQNINFPDSNAVWSVYNEKYFIGGDSTFNAEVYKKYYYSNDSIVKSGNFFALFREDTLVKKVFAISAGDSIEHLLYDFSLKINDTATVFPLSFPPYSGPILIKVEMLDSILVSDKYCKRLKILGAHQNTGMEEYWIEGIGSTMGLFNSGITGVIILDIYYPTLLCFEKDGVNLYSNPNFTDCYENFPVGIEENDLTPWTTIYPNPTNSILLIESDQEIISYQFVSANGKVIMTGNAGKKSFTLNISGLSKGIYILSLKTVKSVVVKKIIKNGV